jgi:hypothetical protein
MLSTFQKVTQITFFGLTAVAAQASFISNTYTGNVGVTVSAFATAYIPGSGNLVVSGLPSTATIVNATFLSENYFADPVMTATFAGNSLGAGNQFANDGGATHLAAYSWNVTSLVTGNGSYTASYAGGNQYLWTGPGGGLL